MPDHATPDPATEAFIARWHGREGGQERANCQPFLDDLCTIIGVPKPDPADATSTHNDYVYERTVRGDDGTSNASTSTSAAASFSKPNNPATAPPPAAGTS